MTVAPISAAIYLRMSTEHQQYSLDNQLAVIRRYAEEHGFAIVKKYIDHAKSGLVLKNRPGLSAILRDVVSHDVTFDAILVLDVSRWGRFQDIDESACYEFLCKQAGVSVYYCGETFSNDTTLVNMILKSLKRSMAAEYSRELSAKVKVGIRRIAMLGFRNGGCAGYGLRRMLVDGNRNPKMILCDRDRKSLSTDHVILTHGPSEEVECVRNIFRLYISDRLSVAEIAERLNGENSSYLYGRPWHPMAVLRVLSHPKYCGSHVFGQSSQILQGPRIRIPKGSWGVVPDAFAPIVSRETFDQAQQIKNSRTIYKNNEQLLDTLRALWAKNGRLTQNLINRSTDVPSVHAFRTRFGSLRHAYQLIGYSGTHCSLRVTQIRRILAGMKESLVKEMVSTFPEELSVERKSWRQRLRLRLKNGDLIAVHLCRGPSRHGDSKVWMLATDRDELSKYSLVARMRENYDSFLDFHLMPCIRIQKRWLVEIDDYRLRNAIRFTKMSELLAATKEVEVYFKQNRGQSPTP